MLYLFNRMLLICRFALLVLLFMSVSVALANPTDSALLTNDQFKLYKSNGLYNVDVTQMNLLSVLKLIAMASQFPIHASSLTDNFLSLICTGTELRQLVECWLDNKADLIVRYKQVD